MLEQPDELGRLAGGDGIDALRHERARRLVGNELARDQPFDGRGAVADAMVRLVRGCWRRGGSPCPARWQFGRAFGQRACQDAANLPPPAPWRHGWSAATCSRRPSLLDVRAAPRAVVAELVDAQLEGLAPKAGDEPCVSHPTPNPSSWRSQAPLGRQGKRGNCRAPLHGLRSMYFPSTSAVGADSAAWSRRRGLLEVRAVASCGRGGIGRRTSSRGVGAARRGGSSPLDRTKRNVFAAPNAI